MKITNRVLTSLLKLSIGNKIDCSNNATGIEKKIEQDLNFLYNLKSNI